MTQLEQFVEIKRSLVRLMSAPMRTNEAIQVTIPNSSLNELILGAPSADAMDEAVKMALCEKGFDTSKPFSSEISPSSLLVTYTQKIKHSKQEKDLICEICKEYEITTEMGRLALLEALKNLTLFDRKQRDYGSGNISDFGEMGVLIRLNDKINRLKNLLKSQGTANFESIADTWDDIANYGIIGKLCNLNLWK